MNCEQATECLADRMTGVLPVPERDRLEQHLRGCAACRAESDALNAIWNGLDQVTVDIPHARMRARFHAALAAYEARTHGSLTERLLERFWPSRPALGVATLALVLGVGLVLGRLTSAPSGRDLAALRDDLRDMSLVLLEHQSATARLRGIGWSMRDAPNPAVIDALIGTVRTDPNVNVRIAAVEALADELGRAEVDAAMLAALRDQDAPLIQVALARALLDASVDGAIPAVEELIARDGVDPSVRDYLSTSLTEMSGRAAPVDRL